MPVCVEPMPRGMAFHVLPHEYNALHARWNALCERLEATAELSDAWWRRIAGAYSEPGRHYHTLLHLHEMFAALEPHRARLDDADAVELAVYFHDLVYDAKARPAGKNEDDSARAFEAFAAELALGHRAPARVAKVAAWIATTKTHKCGAAAGFDERVFMDADMAILARTPWREYARYTAGVRAEYAHVPEVGWFFGRGAFLRGACARAHRLLERRVHALEADARNARRELAALPRALARRAPRARSRSARSAAALAARRGSARAPRPRPRPARRARAGAARALFEPFPRARRGGRARPSRRCFVPA